MKKAWVLSKFYINSLYGISGFISDLKENRNSALKKIGFFILIAFSLSGTVGMFVVFNIKMFDVLKGINQQGIVITLSVISSSLVTFVFGIIGIITTYFVDKEGDLILSMPIKPWQILCSKFASNYLYEAILSFVIMATGFIVYGVKSGSGPLFYISSIIATLLVPLIPLTLGYIVVIPLMRTGSILRKKDFTMIMTGVIAIIFGVALQFLSQSVVKASTNPVAIAASLTAKDGLVSIAKNLYYPSVWATYAITDYGTISGIVNLLVFAFVSIMITVLMVILMQGAYATSIVGSQEVTKHRKFTEGELKEKLRGRSAYSALLDREIKLMNREPIYFMNGPLVILLLPIILGVVFFVQRNEFEPLIKELTKLDNPEYYITVIMAGISVFLGISVNITSTCISREGRTFELLKSMPIEPKKYLNVKLSHGLIFGVLATFVCLFIGGFLLKPGAISILLAFTMALLLMIPILIAGIIMELTWPKLIWDNPQKAMKQNLNGVIIILAGMFVVPLCCYAVLKYITVPMYGYMALIVIPLVISIILYNYLMNYGSKRFYEIEI